MHVCTHTHTLCIVFYVTLQSNDWPQAPYLNLFLGKMVKLCNCTETWPCNIKQGIAKGLRYIYDTEVWQIMQGENHQQGLSAVGGRCASV